MVAPIIPPSNNDNRELPLVHFQTQGVLMQAFSHLASFAFGALMGALLLAMLTFDGVSNSLNAMADAIDKNTHVLSEETVMFPVSKEKKK